MIINYEKIETVNISNYQITILVNKISKGRRYLRLKVITPWNHTVLYNTIEKFQEREEYNIRINGKIKSKIYFEFYNSNIKINIKEQQCAAIA